MASCIARCPGRHPKAVATIQRQQLRLLWAGAQAKEIGLVDELGGLRTAAVEARKLVGLEEDVPVVLVQYPPPRPIVEELAEMFGVIRADARTPDLPLPGTLRELVAFARLLPAGTPVMVPPGWLTIR